MSHPIPSRSTLPAGAGSLPPSSRKQLVETPPVDIWEDERQLLLLADLPGVVENDIELSVQPEGLLLEAVRKPYEPVLRGQSLRPTLPVRFRRSVPLPRGVEPEQIDARLSDGVLRIRIGKQAETARELEIAGGTFPDALDLQRDFEQDAALPSFDGLALPDSDPLLDGELDSGLHEVIDEVELID